MPSLRRLLLRARLLGAVSIAATLLTSVALSAPRANQAPGEEPQALFRWAITSQDLGSVRLPAATSDTWQVGPNGLYYRGVPSFSGDPTFEVILRAPYSGNPLYPERLLVQIPVDFATKPIHERGVLVGFHRYSVSEKDIFINTTLPFEAARRGWMLVAPYGLTDTNFANPQSQASFAAVAHVLYSLVKFNHRRVYAVGFSMGGLNALSFALRHLDHKQLQFAGVVLHTPTLDMLKEFQSSNSLIQYKLADAMHFKDTPTNTPFEFERVSPVRFATNGLVEPDQAPVINFSHRPIYLHANLADPNTTLVSGMIAMRNYLQQRGALVAENLVYEPTLGHNWATLKLGPAIDFVSAYELETAPTPTIEIFADAPGRWLHSELETLSPNAFGRYRLELAPFATGVLNSFALLDTRDIDEIVLRLSQLNLDGALPLHFLHGSADGTSDVLRIEGFAAAPTSITVNGATPAWSNFNGSSGELWIRPTDTGQLVQVVVTP